MRTSMRFLEESGDHQDKQAIAQEIRFIPALLQLTVKLLDLPTKALVRPTPLTVTLDASAASDDDAERTALLSCR